MQKLSQALLKGDYHSITEAWEENLKTSKGQAELIFAMSFAGKQEESLQCYKLYEGKMHPSDRAMASFALGFSALRSRNSNAAKKFFIASKKYLVQDKSGLCPAIEYFYQGKGLYYYFFGKYQLAKSAAEESMQAALKNSNPLVRVFAGDLLGHCLFQLGEAHRGIRLIQEAAEAAKKFGGFLWAESLASEALIYECRVNPRVKQNLAKLESWTARLKTQSYYTRANLALELARQLTLKGQWREAKDQLHRIAPEIYRYDLRRQEMNLHFCFAQLAYLAQDANSLMHSIQAARRCLSLIPDPHFRIRTQLFELKLQRLLKNFEEAVGIRNSTLNLIMQSGDYWGGKQLNAQSEFIGCFPEHALNEDSVEHLDFLIDLELYGLIPNQIGLVPNSGGQLNESDLLVELEDGQRFLFVGPEGVSLLEDLTPQMIFILQALRTKAMGKGELIQKVWGYKYEALRHDQLVYGAINALKRKMGPAARLIESTNDGWKLKNCIWSDKPSRPEASMGLSGTMPAVKSSSFEANAIPKEVAGLNLRQLKALRSLEDGSVEAWNIRSYAKKMKTSPMTAFRDLKGLLGLGCVHSLGRGRSTVYCLSNAE